MTNNRACVIGIWHLGSVVAGCLADSGYTVIGVEKDSGKVQQLNEGTPPLFEPGLEDLFANNIKSKRLSFTTELKEALKETSFVLITYDTPVNEQDKVDLSEIIDTSVELSKYLENDSVIIVSSQVPVGTCEHIKSLVKQNNPSINFDIAYSPENLRLGQAIDVFKNPGRIIVGADNGTTLDRVEQFFSVVDAPVHRVGLKTAEMTKHAINAFLATSISFANEIANICDEVDADALEIAKALRSDHRIGPRAMLMPGLAFGGGTLARDLNVLKSLGKQHDCELPLVNGVLTVNQRQNGIVARKLKKIYGSLENLTIAVLGLTYKPGTSTLRRSASLEIINELTASGARVKAFDPKADLDEVRSHKEFEFIDDPYVVAEDSDALVVVTDWPEFKELDFDAIKDKMRKSVLIDAKNMLNKEELIEKGFSYFGVGRGN